MMWPAQQQQPSVSVVTTVWGVASTTSQAQLASDNMIPSIPTSNTGNVMNQQHYTNPGMINHVNKPYNQPGTVRDPLQGKKERDQIDLLQYRYKHSK